MPICILVTTCNPPGQSMALVSSFSPESMGVKVVCLKKYPLATLALLYDLRTLSFLDEFRLKAHKATCPTFTNACPNQIFFKCLSPQSSVLVDLPELLIRLMNQLLLIP